jgi:hypothetical protein
MMDTTNEKLKQRLKDLYGAPIEYSFGQIAEASGMALDRIEELEAKLETAKATLEQCEIMLHLRGHDEMAAIARTTLAELKGQKDE